MKKRVEGKRMKWEGGHKESMEEVSS